MEQTELGAALWLIPPIGSQLYETLNSTIEGLRPLFNDAHKFDPHVTIVTGIKIRNQAQVDSVLDQANIACRSVPSMKITLSEVQFGSRYFKKVYLGVLPTPELLSLARISKEEFITRPQVLGSQKHYEALPQSDQNQLEQKAMNLADDWVKSEYDPHLSLAYSNHYPIDEALKSTIYTRIFDLFGHSLSEKAISWNGGRLALVNCNGPVSNWTVLGHRDLHG